MREWKCVDVAHHKKIPKTIEEYQKKGCRLHSYAAAGSPMITTHYLLFERETYPWLCARHHLPHFSVLYP